MSEPNAAAVAIKALGMAIRAAIDADPELADQERIMGAPAEALDSVTPLDALSVRLPVASLLRLAAAFYDAPVGVAVNPMRGAIEYLPGLDAYRQARIDAGLMEG